MPVFGLHIAFCALSPFPKVSFFHNGSVRAQGDMDAFLSVFNGIWSVMNGAVRNGSSWNRLLSRSFAASGVDKLRPISAIQQVKR